MPPKAGQQQAMTRWQSQPKLATPDFRSAASVVHVAGPKPQTMSEALAQLKKFVHRSITESNLLGLSDADVDATTELIVQSKEKSEIFNWANTLMLPESFAAEIVKRREDIAKLGTRTDEDNVSTVSMATTAASRKSKTAGKGARGKTLNLASAAEDTTGGLVEGQLFECGCFATQHGFRSNCINCGRIFCLQESDDSCYACGMDPAVCMAYELKVQQGLVDAAAESRNRAQYEKALKQRDTLLQFARERSKRTSVIDDQTGSHAAKGWVTSEERQAGQAADDERRRKVAALHKASGAYTVHLDIVNQSVCLGATQLLQKTEDALQQLSDADAAAKYGLQADPEEEAPLRPGDAARLAALEAEAAEDNGDGYNDNDDDELDADGQRVQPLPALVERIFYGGAAAAKTTAAPAAAAAAVPLVRRIAESRRMQTDYYEDDKVSWRIARQQRRAGFGDADDAELNGPAEGDDEEERYLKRQQARRARPPVDPATWAPANDNDEPDCRFTGCAKPAAASSSTAAAAPAKASASPAVYAADTATTANDDAAASWKKLRHKDDGMCLSMHQPWASLLIAGIKTHEGRSWPSDFRGRLWIHAAAAKPSNVEEIEAQYVPFLAEGQLFPTEYPTSCLLGYVVVTDVMDRQTYEATFPPELRQESSEYKFICCGATPLPFPLVMDGKHKIFKLEKKLWLASRKQLNEPPPRQQ